MFTDCLTEEVSMKFHMFQLASEEAVSSDKSNFHHSFPIPCQASLLQFAQNSKKVALLARRT